MNNPTAADTVLDVALTLYAKRVPPSGNAEALEALRDVLVEELGLTPERATEELHRALIRRGMMTPDQKSRALAAAMWKAAGL